MQPLQEPSESDFVSTKRNEVSEAEEEDPLDAFMNDLKSKPQSEPNPSKKIRREDFEEEDHIESYISHMHKKGVEVGKVNKDGKSQFDSNLDSDEEVYETAKRVDIEMGYEDEESGKRDVDPLPPIDHDTIDYSSFERDFYDEHPEVTSLTPDQVKTLRKSYEITVSGYSPPNPCPTFGHFNLNVKFTDAIAKVGYAEPTSIQKQGIPTALNGRDMIGIAKTGSGKTVTYLLPLLVHLLDQPELRTGDGPIGLILVPTRELAVQVGLEARKFGKNFGIKVGIIYGGVSKMEQFKDLRAGVDILVGTPGRIIDMIKMKGTNLLRVTFFVLDEADRMMDLGFEASVKSIANNVRPDRQTLMFSATFPKRIENLARSLVHNPVRIVVGHHGEVNSDVDQHFHVLTGHAYKWPWLMNNLPTLLRDGGKGIVFVGKIAGAEELGLSLKEEGFNCCTLHGDILQSERDQILLDFRSTKIQLLVATDLAARGLDIKAVTFVVNYDVANTVDDHVHRVGRTGRAGQKGVAHTLITEEEDRMAGELVRGLESSGQAVPNDLLNLAMKNPKFVKQRSFNRNRGGGRNRGGQLGRGRQFHGASSGSQPTGSNRITIQFQKASTNDGKK